MVFESVLGRGSGVDEGLETGGETRFDEVHGPEDVGADDALHLGLVRVGTVRGQMKNPFRSRQSDFAGHRLAVQEVGLVQMHVVSDVVDSPTGVPRSYEQMNLVPVTQQSAGQVGADESGSPGEKDVFHQVGFIPSESQPLKKLS